MNRRASIQPRLLRCVVGCVLFSGLLWLLMLLQTFQSLPYSVRIFVVCVQQVTAWVAVVTLLWWFIWGAGSRARNL